MSDLVLSFSFKASERLATDGGRKLTRLMVQSPSLLCWKARQSARLSGHRPSQVLEQDLAKSQVLPVLGACLDRSFDAIESVPVDPAKAPLVHLKQVQGLTGSYLLRHIFLGFSDPHSLGGVEGDEVVVSLVLAHAAPCVPCDTAQTGVSVAMPDPAPPGAPAVLVDRACAGSFGMTLDGPPASSREAMLWIHQLAGDSLPALGNAFSGIAALMPVMTRPGFYAIEMASSTVDKISMAAGEAFDGWRASASGQAVAALLAGYLLRCYVCAQRLERQLLAFEPGADWDSASRQLLLARGRHLAFTRFALIKNRAVHGAPVLQFYESALHRLRLRSLSGDLGALMGQCNEVLQGRNAYLDSSRLRTIEVVLFVASMLSLAIGLNAIQMPPFYDAQATNALSRLEFWLVVVATVVLFVLMWGTINGWRHTRCILRWARRSMNRP